MGRLPRLKFTQSDISLKHLKYHFITGYEFFLKAVLGLQHNSAMGILKKLKKIVRQCVANDWLEKDPFLNYKVKTPFVPVYSSPG
jgi:hypothetical protein